MVSISPNGTGISHPTAPAGESHHHPVLGVPDGLLPDDPTGMDLGVGVVETGPPPGEIHPTGDPGVTVVIGIFHPQGPGIESPVAVTQVLVVEAVNPPRAADQGESQGRHHVLVLGLVNGNNRGPCFSTILAAGANHPQVGGTLMGALSPHAHEIAPRRVKDVNVVGILVAFPRSLLQIDRIVGVGPFPVVGVAVPVGHLRFVSLRCRRSRVWRRPGLMAADQPPNLVEVPGQLKEKTAALGELPRPPTPRIRRRDATGSGSANTARPQKSPKPTSLFEIDSIRG